jgi:hypothetical protein
MAQRNFQAREKQPDADFDKTHFAIDVRSQAGKERSEYFRQKQEEWDVELEDAAVRDKEFRTASYESSGKGENTYLQKMFLKTNNLLRDAESMKTNASAAAIKDQQEERDIDLNWEGLALKAANANVRAFKAAVPDQRLANGAILVSQMSSKAETKEAYHYW